jgi:hypothetical protein
LWETYQSQEKVNEEGKDVREKKKIIEIKQKPSLINKVEITHPK